MGIWRGEKMKNVKDIETGIASWYTGELNDKGERHGYGVHMQADGLKYEGYFQNDIYHGYGKATFGDRLIYDGNWNNGIAEGELKW
jgi:hypothetical protein